MEVAPQLKQGTATLGESRSQKRLSHRGEDVDHRHDHVLAWPSCIAQDIPINSKSAGRFWHSLPYGSPDFQDMEARPVQSVKSKEPKPDIK